LTRSAFQLTGATLFAQVAGVLLSPVYSRLYDPEAYGVFGFYNSALSLLITIGCLCYERGIPVAADDQEARSVMRLSLTLLCLMCLVTLAGAGSVAWLKPGMLKPEVRRYLWLLPAGLLAAGFYSVVRFWALRLKDYKGVALTAVRQCIAFNLVNLAFGLAYPRALGLICAAIGGGAAGVFFLAKRTQALAWDRGAGAGSQKTDLQDVAQKYSRLFTLRGPGVLFNSLGLYLPQLLVVSYFGIAVGGQFELARRVIMLPINLIGGAISQIFLAEAASVARERPEALRALFGRVLTRAAPFSIPVLLLGIVAPMMFPVVFGSRWERAGQYALWLALYSAPGFIVSALSYVPTIVGRLHGQLLLDVVRAVMVFLAFYLPHRWGQGVDMAIRCYAATMLVIYALSFFLYRHQAIVVSRLGRTNWTAKGAA
jgi:O-antigen/teichoic acid export membrane protein